MGPKCTAVKKVPAGKENEGNISITEIHTDTVAVSQAEFLKYLKESREAERIEMAIITPIFKDYHVWSLIRE